MRTVSGGDAEKAGVDCGSGAHGGRRRGSGRGRAVGQRAQPPADVDRRLDPRSSRRFARPAADGGPVSASLSSAITLVATAARRMRNTVRELRTQRGLSQGQLGSAMGVSRQTINSIEQERYTPSLSLALALARFFQTTVEAMFDAGD
jgi:putative transcriptional regulator